MPQIKRSQFMWDYYKKSKGVIPYTYASLDFNTIKCHNKEASKNATSNVYYTSLFPDFFQANFVNQKEYNFIKVPHLGMSGTGILLDESHTYESYQKKFIKKSFLKGFRRTLRRLELSFNISYEYNYGNISEERCEFLIGHLKTMLNRRFKEKHTQSVFLDEWEDNVKDLRDLINEKRSSLFVVYHDKTPISISLNRHINEHISFSECHAYNIDYSKFGLGHIDNYIQLKWSLNNNVYFLDLGLGNLDYKGKWCNKYYNLEYHIFYKKNSLSAKLTANIELLKINLKNTLKKLKVDIYLDKLKNRNQEKDIKEIPYNTKEIDITEPITDVVEIPMTSDFYDMKLKKRMVMDFLYTFEEVYNNVRVYKSKNNENHFYIKGNKKGILLTF